MVDIGSSDAPAVLGVSPHTTPWQLWARLVGLLPEKDEPTEIMRRGTALESTVLRMFLEEELQCQVSDAVVNPHTTRWRQERPWQRASPDAVLTIFNAPALVEVKCTVNQSPSTPRVDWLVQCLHQRMVYPEAERQYLVAFGALHLEWWAIPKHQRALDRVLREEERFLELVEKEIPPPVRAADAAVLAKAWPITTPEPVQLGDEALVWTQAFEEAKTTIRQMEEAAKLAEAQIKQAIGEHEVALLPDGSSWTWKPYQRKEYTVKASMLRRLTRHGGKDNGDDA